MEGWPEWARFIWGFVLAMIFGLLAYAQKFSNKAERPDFDWWTFWIKGATAGAVGLLVTWLLGKKGIDAYFLNFLIAIGGWGGAETIAVFREVFNDTIRRFAGRAAKEEEDERAKS